MNSMSHSWFLSFFVFACICIDHVLSSLSYSQHCSSIFPSFNTTALSRTKLNSAPLLSTPYFTVGESLSRTEPGKTYYYVQRNLRLRIQSDSHKTTAAGVYEVQGSLNIRLPYSSDDDPSNYTYGGYRRSRNRGRGSIKFSMEGLWSEESRKLCMAGSASWKGFDRRAVLKLRFGDNNRPTINTSVASGSLESVDSANNRAYFDPIFIFGFPRVHSYNYSLVPKETDAKTAMFTGDAEFGNGESLSIEGTQFCSVIGWGLRPLELDYAADCTPHDCSSVGFLPRYLSLNSIQCAEGEEKARFVANFHNYSYYNDDDFGVGTAMIGEMQWDDEKKRMIGVACQILNPAQHFENAVGDCTMKLSLRFPSVLNIRNDDRIVGQIWSSKSASRNISVAKKYDGHEVVVSGQRYEYTELDRARTLCSAKEPSKKEAAYPDGNSYDMRFDMSIKNHRGQQLGWAYAKPIWVGNDSYVGGDIVSSFDGLESDAVEIHESAENHNPTEMSYIIRIYPSYHVNSSSNNISSPSLNWTAMNPHGEIVVTAEGLYDTKNGHLCMVGCRKLVQNSSHSSIDCDIVVEFEFPPVDRKRGGFIKGSITSTRGNMDPLQFEDLILQSTSHYIEVAEVSIWRMDLEITMVLISNTLACIFVGLQIFHVKKKREVTSFISLVMLVILSIGHMIPLVLNFEAVFLGNPGKQTLELGSGGRLEANEVAVRVITMVALLLQLRLLQLVWVAKQSDDESGKSRWSGEKKAGFVSLSLYILGGMLSLVVNWIRKTYVGGRYSVWGNLRSYAGLILDGFLVPQILFNIFRGGSPQKALSHPFYIGMSSVRLVPHAYNQYRAHNYPKYDLNATYYYANPAADLYSTAWDIIIPCGVVVLAAIVFVQQRYGGRCILPKKFRGLEMYEKVATVDRQ